MPSEWFFLQYLNMNFQIANMAQVLNFSNKYFDLLLSNMVVSFMFLYRMGFGSLPGIFQDFWHLVLSLKDLITNKTKLQSWMWYLWIVQEIWNISLRGELWSPEWSSLFSCRAKSLGTGEQQLKLQPWWRLNRCKRMAALLTWLLKRWRTADALILQLVALQICNAKCKSSPAQPFALA